jgi:transposase
MPRERCPMARVRRTFTPEFKRDAVALVKREGKTVSEVARNLGIARSLLQRWIEQHRDRDRDGNPRKSRGAEGEELRQLRKQLRDVTEERDILKKALAYFADDQK